METIYILLGSNMDNRLGNLIQARLRIKEVGEAVGCSSVYVTKAWGDVSQADFFNQVIQLKSDYDPQDLLKKFKLIEIEMGRTSGVKWGPRRIDIDILFIGNEIIHTADLTIPHPYIQERRFVLEPLAEIAPDLVHPIFNLTIQELLTQCQDALPVNKISI